MRSQGTTCADSQSYRDPGLQATRNTDAPSSCSRCSFTAVPNTANLWSEIYQPGTDFGYIPSLVEEKSLHVPVAASTAVPTATTSAAVPATSSLAAYGG
jgi:hypothetical protein